MKTLPILTLLLAATAAPALASAETITLYDGSEKIGFKYLDFSAKGVVTDNKDSFTIEATEDSDGGMGLFGIAGTNLSSPKTFPAEGNRLRVEYRFLDDNEAAMFKVSLNDKDEDGAGEQYKFDVEPDMDDATETSDGFMEILLPLGEDDASSRNKGSDAGFSEDGDGIANYDLTQWSIQSPYGQMAPLMVEIRAIEIVGVPEP